MFIQKCTFMVLWKVWNLNWFLFLNHHLNRHSRVKMSGKHCKSMWQSTSCVDQDRSWQHAWERDFPSWTVTFPISWLWSAPFRVMGSSPWFYGSRVMNHELLSLPEAWASGCATCSSQTRRRSTHLEELERARADAVARLSVEYIIAVHQSVQSPEVLKRCHTNCFAAILRHFIL